MNRGWIRCLLRGLLCAAVGALAPCAGAIDDLHEAEMTVQPEPKIGKSTFTFRFIPKKTQVVEKLVFECVYRQVLVIENSRGEKFEKIYEPEVFKYERRDEKFVDELAKFINFRAPTEKQMIVDCFGKNVFNDQADIVVDRVRMTATIAGKQAWQMEFRAGGVYRHDPGTGEWKAVPK